jgi:hypothetical protein
MAGATGQPHSGGGNSLLRSVRIRPRFNNDCPEIENHHPVFKSHRPEPKTFRPALGDGCPDFDSRCPDFQSFRPELLNRCPDFFDRCPEFQTVAPLLKAIAPISGTPDKIYSLLPQSQLCGFPQGFGLRQSSAALELRIVSKAPEGWRSPRRYRAVLPPFSTFNPQPSTIN